MGKKFDDNANKVFEFLKNFIDENGYPPSVREICEELGIKSTASVHSYLQSLQDSGYIAKGKTKNRAIEILDNYNISRKKIVNVPLVGRVACGSPSLALEDVQDVYPLPSDMFGNDDLFLLTASGDSMIEAGIYSGDKIVVKKQDTASNGEIVVALLDDESTVKRFYKRSDHYILHPENINMKDIIVYNELSILGVVIGIIRKF